MIGFGCICARRDFKAIRNQSYNHEEMGHFRSLKGLMTYKVDLPGEYGVSATFNVSDLTLFDVGDDSRSNPFEERGDDEDKPNTKRNHANDPLDVPITRTRANKIKEKLNECVQNIWSKMDPEELETSKKHEGQPLIHLIQAKKSPILMEQKADGLSLNNLVRLVFPNATRI
jgi:hypothetical protein